MKDEFDTIVQFSMEIREKDIEKAYNKFAEFFNSCGLEAFDLKVGVRKR